MRIVALDSYTFIFVHDTVTEAEAREIHPRLFFHIMEKLIDNQENSIEPITIEENEKK